MEGMIASTSAAGRGFFNGLERGDMDSFTLKQRVLNEYDSPLVGRSFRRKVTDYVENRYLEEDGGYCFYRIPPSSGMDTYFAVKSLSILGLKPQHPEAVVNFILNQVKEDSTAGVIGVFATVEVIGELSQIPEGFRDYAQQRVMALQNNAGGFGTLENFDVEVTSELHETYRAVKILRTLNVHFDEEKVTRFVLALLNPDGGYGRERRSTLASTFYATAIHKSLGAEPREFAKTKGYLRSKENDWLEAIKKGLVYYLEDLFWLVGSLTNLGQNSNFPDQVTRFVVDCQVPPFYGFARATRGIATLENTFYALSILREVGAL